MSLRLDGVVAVRHAGEQIRAVSRRGRRGDDVARGVDQIHRHTGQAGLTGVLYSVAVLVQPDAIADGAGGAAMTKPKSSWVITSLATTVRL